LLGVRRLLRQSFFRRRPDLWIPIDFGAFHLPLCRQMLSLGQKILYWMPPGSWRKSDSVLGKPPPFATAVVTPFARSKWRYRLENQESYFFGHPLLDVLQPPPQFAARQSLGIPDASHPVIALFPGSRQAELRHIFPPMLAAARLLLLAWPQACFVWAAEWMLNSHQDWLLKNVPHAKIHRVGTRWRALSEGDCTKPALSFAVTDSLTALAASDFVLAKSGTTTLEALICGKPMVICYKASRPVYWQYRLASRGPEAQLRFIGIPNILAGEMVFPELLQDQCSPHSIAAMAQRVWQEWQQGALQSKMLGIVSELGPTGALLKTAELAISLAEKSDA
jgi:lipid-A-disaccharide synthase